MDYDQFRATLDQLTPPAALPPLLAALWWDSKGDWSRAHEIAQSVETPDAAWVHAYLHRKEGDTGTPRIGITKPASRIANCPSTPNGRRSPPRSWPDLEPPAPPGTRTFSLCVISDPSSVYTSYA
jgi:hypothetical protein